jgi:hypothetical protein
VILELPGQVDGRTPDAIRGNGLVAVEVLADTESQGVGAVPKQHIEDRHIVVDEGAFVAPERLGHLGDDLRNIDFEHRHLSMPGWKLPSRIVKGLPAVPDIRVLAPPSRDVEACPHMFWHRRTQADPSQVWLRSVIREIAAGV